MSWALHHETHLLLLTQSFRRGTEDLHGLLSGSTIPSSIDNSFSWWDATATSQMKASPTASYLSNAGESSGSSTKGGGTPESSFGASSADSPPSSPGDSGETNGSIRASSSTKADSDE